MTYIKSCIKMEVNLNMALSLNLIYLSFLIVSNGIKIEGLVLVQDVIRKTVNADKVSESEISRPLDIANFTFAAGMVSVDCLRCLCLQRSQCLPVGCEMKRGTKDCGYFRITRPFWQDCGKLGTDWRKCAKDVTCSSQCVQNYMKRYAEKNNCVLKCEGYSRELRGGPNGCNNPRTVPFWIAVQKQPGCKGVE